MIPGFSDNWPRGFWQNGENGILRKLKKSKKSNISRAEDQMQMSWAIKLIKIFEIIAKS